MTRCPPTHQHQPRHNTAAIMDEMIEQVAPTNVSLDDLEELINSLSPDEVAELAECDPDDSSMPPYMRCAYRSNLSAMFDEASKLHSAATFVERIF